MKRVALFVNRLGSRRAVKHVSCIMGAQGINLGIQAATFLLLARLLGAFQYGFFSGAYALINTVAPYAVLGAGMLFMRYVIEKPGMARIYWGNAVAICCSVGLLLSIALYFIGPRFAKVGNGWLFLLLALSYCLFTQIIAVGASVFQTFGKLEFTAVLTAAGNAVRLVILIVLFLWLKHATAIQWAMGSLLAAVIACGYTIYAVQKDIGRMRLDWSVMRNRFSEGVGFSFAGTTQAIYNDIDKMVLSRDGYVAQNGAYSVAYRIVDFATAPLAAVDTVVLPKFFALSAKGIRSTLPLLYRSVLLTGGLGILIGGGIVLVSPLVPHLVGKGYASVSLALLWLAPLPFLRALHRLAGGVLTGSGHQNLRTATQLLVAVMNALLNVLLIPGRGWIAAAWVSLISDGMLAVLTVVVLFVLVKRQTVSIDEMGR